MPLEDYRRKRDFAATPEPPPGDVDDRSGRYTVQRHRATALHYDFRLELGGVLVSWAVPKGPTLDSRQRRLAMRTEDHPIEYFDFEGVIPRGQYGGGDVIVWDWGTWEPEESSDPVAALRKGELKFRLSGEKLHGRFTIVRTDGGPGGRWNATDEREKWLLMHKADETAVRGWSAEDHPRSVKSGRTNDEVKEGRPAVWVSGVPADSAEIDLSAAREEPMPEFIPPMKATLATGPFSGADWLFEVKWDGYRVEAVVRDGAVRLWTRNRQDAGRYFPDLTDAPTWIEAREAIVDGEVVALDERGRPDFSLLQDHTGLRGIGSEHGERGSRRSPDERAAIPLAYQAFDLLYLDGRSLLDVPLEHRKRLLRTVLRPHPIVQWGGHVESDGEAFTEAARAQQLEGVLAKLRTSRYEPGRRSRAWLKIKLRREQELVVAGWLPGKGNAKDLGSLIVGVYDGDDLRHAGQVGSGLDGQTRREVRKRLDDLSRDDSPLDPVPRIKGARWVEPRLVIRAEFAEWTTDRLLRQAAFKGLEIGKDPRTVRREEAVDTDRARKTAEARAPTGKASPAEKGSPAEKASRAKRSARTSSSAKGGVAGKARAASRPARAAATDVVATALTELEDLGKAGTLRVGEHEVRLTNLDKVLFEGRDGQPPVTKRDLVRYHLTIAPVIAPYLAGRGVTLHRYPDGAQSGKGFWQKDLPGHTPEWISRWRYHHEKEGPKDYVVVDHPATLAWLAQEAAIELHPWTSRTDTPNQPTYALIDVDPGADTSWDEVLALTRLYRAALGHLGVRGHPKVTGKRGIQVWIGIRKGYGFDDTRDWVESLSRAVGAMVPELVSWEWSKRARGGKARLDYTQNAVNKTLVAPYSTRPAPGAPVSMPIAWDELDDPELRPDRWTVSDAVTRVAERGDLFDGVLTDEQELPPIT